jgi:GntR family transcriptional repressor for pyruvate dehydrogenase complex
MATKKTAVKSQAAAGVATAAQLLRESILQGNFAPGQRIPPERDLAVTYSVSRGSIREAIRGLVSLGILESKRGSGTYVRRLESSELFKSLEFVLDVDPQSLSHFFELRRLLEPAAAAIAADRLTSEDRERLLEVRDELAKLKQSPAGLARLIELDHEIHSTISESTRNPLIHMIISSVRATAARARGLASGYNTHDLDSARNELSRLIEALCDSDSLRSEGAMMWHLESSMTGWKQT